MYAEDVVVALVGVFSVCALPEQREQAGRLLDLLMAGLVARRGDRHIDAASAQAADLDADSDQVAATPQQLGRDSSALGFHIGFVLRGPLGQHLRPPP